MSKQKARPVSTKGVVTGNGIHKYYLKMHLNMLILDCLEAYNSDYIPTSIEPPSNIDFPLVNSVYPDDSVKYEPTQEISPVSSESEGCFACPECKNVYSGLRQLKRHLQSHKNPHKYACTVQNCPKTSHRVDAMRSHIRAHEKRDLAQSGAAGL
jgi:hypothetical protein